MTLDEYKMARDRSGISIVDNWCRTIGISGDTHKSINSGRMAVSEAVANRIGNYFSDAEARAITLRDALDKELSVAFDESSVELDPNTFDIYLTLPNFGRIKVENCGVDTMNGWGVYNINFGHGKEPLVLLHARVPLWQKKPHLFQWYMWRGPFSGMQSYWNDVNAKMLAECFRQ
ncbi:hypothetical protein LP085_30705 [Achromobacter sp. MY14]|uniref:hypothetical protein n=1 Tax=unclassified Achromobacter TaxID=2626865 RepID=UPI001E51D36B|nr:hypothetical protein [Achromobacter sp. MY14]MCD0501255.1 hypothetical protein [Achromobacter sp. MY14]